MSSRALYRVLIVTYGGPGHYWSFSGHYRLVIFFALIRRIHIEGYIVKTPDMYTAYIIACCVCILAHKYMGKIIYFWHIVAPVLIISISIGWFHNLTRAYDNNGRCPRQKLVFGILYME